MIGRRVRKIGRGVGSVTGGIECPGGALRGLSGFSIEGSGEKMRRRSGDLTGLRKTIEYSAGALSRTRIRIRGGGAGAGWLLETGPL